MNIQLKRTIAACTSLVFSCAVPALAQVKPTTTPKPAVAPPKPTIVQAPAAPASPPAPPAPAPVATPGAAPAAAPGAGDAAASPPPPEWVSRCASEGRQSALECVIEQIAYLSKTGQLVAAVTIRVPADTRQPSMAIQVPVGLFLPAGVSLQIDEGKALALALQTCDLKGCYAGTLVSPEMLAALRAGKKLSITFQNLTKENITIPMQLTNFAPVYQKIQ
jgi:invasion protein IalB